MPRFTCSMLAFYLALRIVHVNGYHSYRGHSAAYAPEEFMKLITVIFVLGAMSTSAQIATGITLKRPYEIFTRFFKRK